MLQLKDEIVFPWLRLRLLRVVKMEPYNSDTFGQNALNTISRGLTDNNLLFFNYRSRLSAFAFTIR